MEISDITLRSQSKMGVSFDEHGEEGVYEGSLYVSHADRDGRWGVEFGIVDGSDTFDIYEKEHIIAVRDVLTNIINNMEAS
jgi:hypothetical protein